MSPELNGNPPLVTKRKKNRDKKNSSACGINDANIPTTYNCFQNNLSAFPTTFEGYPTFYFGQNYSMPTEPTSLPVYPTNNHGYAVNPNVAYTGNFSNKPNLHLSNEFMSLPVEYLEQLDDTRRRFSDPGPNDSDSSSNSIEGRVINKLSQQINTLKECNRKLSREMSEMRMEMNILKQQQSSRHYERDYEPGMLAEFIKEVRDAARVREDALIAKVKHMIEEKQLSMNQFQMVTDKNRNNDRLSKLEEQMKNLSVIHMRSDDIVSSPSSSTLEESPNSARQVIELEREALVLRRELQDARAKKEESDQKLLLLDKRLSHILSRKEPTISDMSDDGKASTISAMDSFSASSGPPPTPQRITLSGPVTDL